MPKCKNLFEGIKCDSIYRCFKGLNQIPQQNDVTNDSKKQTNKQTGQLV